MYKTSTPTICKELQECEFIFTIDYPQFYGGYYAFEPFTSEIESPNYWIDVAGTFEFERDTYGEPKYNGISELEIRAFGKDGIEVNLSNKLQAKIEKLIRYKF
jgi:hypothetical protein